jgi:hypothetical protein
MKSTHMENTNHKSNRPSEDHVDRILGAALAKYASVEPRTGLEDRILANLNSANMPAAQPTWWRWGLGAALAAVIVALVIGLRSANPNHEVAHHQTPVQARSSEAEFHQLGPDVQVHEHQAPIDISAGSAITMHLKPRTPKNPKLDQFPSPHPLSEQEQILARYVVQFNDEAVIVARVRTEAMRMDREKEMRETEQRSSQDPQAR